MPPFAATWLQERFRFDEAARHPAVEADFLQHLPQEENLFLVDVGAGTGANFLHFYSKLAANQQWLLIDRDEQLLQLALERIVEQVPGGAFAIQRSKNQVVLRQGEQMIQVRIQKGSFTELAQLIDLSRVHAVLANAFFDLFSEQHFARFAQEVLHHSSSLLLTLNYTGMRFMPTLPADAQVIGWYERHMRRPQPEGRAMGPACGDLMSDALTPIAAAVSTGESCWQVEHNDGLLLNYLLNFMEDALGEWGLNEAENVLFKQWLQQRRAQVRAGRLRAEIAHQDFFAK